MAIQVNELASVVTQNINNEIADGLEKINPMWDYFAKSGKKKVNGGTYLQFPIKLLANQSSAFIPGTGAVVDTSPSAQLQYGVLNWKWMYFSVNFTLEDFTIAGGKEQIIDFIKTKKDGALADFYRELSTAVYGSSASNALKFEGLEDIVAASGTTYAGLTDTDYADATDPYLPYISTATELSYAALSDLITQSRARSQRMGGSGKMIGLMNPYLYNKMMSILQGQQMFVNGSGLSKAGFQGFVINGVEFYMDVDCPGTADGSTEDNYVYVIPEEVLKFNYKFGLDSASPMDRQIQLQSEPTISIQKYLAGNIVCNNRRRISVCKTFK